MGPIENGFGPQSPNSCREGIIETKIKSTHLYKGIATAGMSKLELVYCNPCVEALAHQSCHLFNTERKLGAVRPAAWHNGSSNPDHTEQNFLPRGREPERFDQNGEDNF